MRLLSWLALSIVSLTLLAQPAFAAKDEHGAGATTEGGKAEPKKVDVAEKFGLKRYDLGIYTLIVFLLLFFVLGKFAWGPMMAGLDKREASMRKTHEDAEASRQEAAKALAEVQTRLAKTNDEIRGMLEEARRDAQVVKDQIRADAAAEIQAERIRIRREIDIARDEALKEIYQQAVQLASIMSTKAIGRELSSADHARLLDDAVRDLRTNLGKPRLDA